MATKIMLVEDDALILQLLRYQLGGAGYEIVCCTTGFQALERLLLEAPDLVLLDVMMPKMSGWDACRQIRACSSVPIVMLTAKGTDDDVVAGLNSGADDYITKPFTLPVLLARVEAVLRRSEARRSGANSHARPGEGRAQHDLDPFRVTEPLVATDLHRNTLMPLSPDSAQEYLVQRGDSSLQEAPDMQTDASPSAPEAPVTPIGRQLREARMNKGATLLEVSRECDVRWEFLQALEQENFAYMPRPELRHALRTYCTYLDLDVYALVGRPVPRLMSRPLLRIPLPELALLLAFIVVIVGVVLMSFQF